MTILANLNEKRGNITHTSDERRNQGNTSLGAGNCLTETEEEREVAVNAIVTLKLPSSLDTLPRRCDLDEDTLFLHTNTLVQRNQLLGLGLGSFLVKG